MYSRLPEDKPSGSKHVEDIVKIKIRVTLTMAQFGGLFIYVESSQLDIGRMYILGINQRHVSANSWPSSG